MALEWQPSWLGQHFTGTYDWHLRLDGMELVLTSQGQTMNVRIESEDNYHIQRGVFWTAITLTSTNGHKVLVDGLPNAQGTALRDALTLVLSKKRLKDNVAFLEEKFQLMNLWLAKEAAQRQECFTHHRWLTHEQQESLLAARSGIDTSAISALLQQSEIVTLLNTRATAINESLIKFSMPYQLLWSQYNAEHVQRELEACKNLLEHVESQPLTREQAEAVLCFDNRVQVVASAGSGKTSTMVAKAAYAIYRGLLKPERIILLAFNKQAAEELKERADKAFERLGMQGVTVEASTFHALGLSLIGKATKKKPRIPDWAVDTHSGIGKLTDIVDQLKDRFPQFRRQWDLFRFVFARDFPAFGGVESFDVWDSQGNGSLLTKRGERVKSSEEVAIADFLFLNGVNYLYEAPYSHITADETHSQYHPDFYYPDLDLYHEHFALDANGIPPSHFKNYLDGVHWKRQLHIENGTALFETTSHGIYEGFDFDRLEKELTARGLTLDPNPDRKIPSIGSKPMESAELIGLIRTFMSHAKSNCLSMSALEQRLEAMTNHTSKHRHRMFLDIVSPIMEAWNAALAENNGIDFEDMLNQAAELLENNAVESPYDLVMADEFQDASRARARLCRALVQQPGKFLFAVGDDWQSINRFAGADVSVMTNFRNWFGHGQLLKLEQTFRCPQALCDVSSKFVSKNPAQISKRVRSATLPHGPVLQTLKVNHQKELASAIDLFIMDLMKSVRDGTTPPGRNGKVSVYVLGRYNSDKQYMPEKQHRFKQWIDLSFLTIHRSKGSEADYVILPAMVSMLKKGLSFPNNRTDDSVLAMAMPDGDNFPLGEERRLFYVALTRARRTAVLFTVRGQISTFIQELAKDSGLVITDLAGNPVKEQQCPACKQGILILRTGPHGRFLSCSNYPQCCYKPPKSRHAKMDGLKRLSRANS